MFLEVDVNPDKPGEWIVFPHNPDKWGKREPLRSFPSRAAAWHMACWHPFERDNTLPKITLGDHFIPENGRGYTTDPRHAEAVPAESVDAETYQRIKATISRFIRARIGSMMAEEPLGVEPDPEPESEQPAGEPPSEPEPVTEAEGVPVHWTEVEALRDALSDSDRSRYDNFADLAENAPSASAREYWDGQAEAILEGVRVK